MIVAFYIFLALLATGVALYVHHRIAYPASGQEEAEDASGQEAETEECCGLHLTCEKDSLLASVSREIVYYDDEELDRFGGRRPDDYDDDEIEEFRSVMLTLLPEDIAGWGRSIQLRGIELPEAVREELLMIVGEARREAAAAGQPVLT